MYCYIEPKKKDKPAAATSATTPLPTNTPTPPVPPITTTTEDLSTTTGNPTPAARAKALKKRLKQINEIKEKMSIDITYRPDAGQLGKLASEEGLLAELEAVEI